MRLAALITSGVVFAWCLAFSAVTDDEPKITITNLTDMTVGFRYVWALPRSSLASLPHWNPLSGEVPLSPHAAASNATKFFRARFDSSAKLRIRSISLLRADGGYDKPGLRDIWMYEVHFQYDRASDAEKALLNVMVLLDGTVVTPTVTRLK